ncbi:MAG: hypothetical protein ABUL69_02265, partial [Peristeroidobacter soli]
MVPAAEDEPTSRCGAAPSVTFDDGKVTIAPGQVICLRVSSVDGKLALTTANGDTPKNEVVVIDLSSEGDSTVLVVHNGTPSVIKYRAKFQPPGQKKWYPTTICPVQAGIMGFEQWPHGITTMQLSDFRVLPQSA